LLLFGEALIICGSFLLATACIIGPDAYTTLIYENGLLKIVSITGFTLILSYYCDLYEPQRISGRWELYFRFLLVLSVLSFVLAGLVFVFPGIGIAPNVLASGISILAIALLPWRSLYERIISLKLFKERVYVLGKGERARTVSALLSTRRDAGLEVVEGWTQGEFASDIERFAADLRAASEPKTHIDRVIVAMEDRRGAMPVQELLHLRLQGVVIEEAGVVTERLLGRLSLAGLNPSNLIFTHGFHVRASQQIARRLVSFSVAFIASVICLPVIPFLILAVRLSSPGPVLFRQTRVGLGGRHFSVIKFRTMRRDAEAAGAVWATKDDPRVTRLGRFMRKTRLDEIPQLWNVLRGEMGFVGPRPERPEFVQWLTSEIPYYDLRHIIRPGITGWAQVRYQYGASLEETRQKLEYDLYYIKHLSLGLDLLIMFETIKTIILRRGAQ
jgi:sugar transferase (PEP-CTERM system associated)